MSVKAVKEVYDQICDQYFEMVNDLKDFEDEAAKGLIDPERVELIKQQIEPIKQNYQRWSYIMYLLNQPVRKKKHKRYEEQNKKLLKDLDSSNSIEGVLKENADALKKIGS